ncbi:MAG: VCBS repeat-containing protein, partial [Bacteroidetes bacterium]|nr:VCBS repeat-containing protein [Bacteroidota bacterium]
MDNKILTVLILIISLQLFGKNVLSQESTITLNQPVTGTKNYIARDAIKLLPGFSYSAQTGMSFHASIDEFMICNANYQSNPPNPDDYEIIPSLPVGKIDGVANVSPSGAATYQVPIKIPAGSHGMQPNITIVYNSQSGNGILGMGWNIAGLSAITRVPQTIYHDEQVNGVNLDTHDRFALDGNRLINIDGNYGASDTEYRTEQDIFAKVISNETAGNGPKWFSVQAKNGNTLEFGHTTDSRIMLNGTALMWRLNKITDNNGNYIDYIYDSKDGESWIKQIKYSGNTIKFIYEQKTDQNTVYLAGQSIKQSLLLHSIKVEYSGSLVKQYDFKYYQDFYSHLTKIEESGYDGSKLNSTVVGWGDKGFHCSSNDFELPGDAEYRIGDYDGDGKSDLVAFVYEFINDVKTYTHWELFINQGNNDFNKVIDNGELPDHFYPFDPANPHTQMGLRNMGIESFDLNGDGLEDMLLGTRIGDNYNYIPYYSTKNNFIKSTNSFYVKFKHLFTIGDFNGDGILDAFAYNNESENKSENHWKIHFFNNNTTITGTGFKALDNRQPFLSGDFFYPIDYDGDGKTDLLTMSENLPTILEYDASVSPERLVEKYRGNYPSYNNLILLGDFNGEGKTDLLTFNGAHWWTGMNTGKKFNIEEFLGLSSPTYNSKHFIRDFNGDGKADVLELILKDTIFWKDEISVYSNARMFLSNGNGSYCFDSLLFEHIENKENIVFHFGDFNGDGKSEIFIKKKNVAAFRIMTFYNNEQKHLVQSITNGFNQKIKFHYKLLTQGGNFYSKDEDANFPVVDIQPALNAVEYIEQPDGVGGTSKTYYKYKGAKVHKQGKGFLGFSQFTADNSNTGKQISTYEINDTYYNVSLKNAQTYSGNTLVSTINNTNAVKYLGDRIRYFPYVSNSVKKNVLYDITTTTTSNDYDNYGNPKTVTITVGANATTINNAFTNAGAWCSSKISESTVTKSSPDNSDYSVKSNFYYDAGNIKHKTVQYDGKRAITTKFENYDNFGNPHDIITEVSDDKNRTVNLQYDGKGRLIKKINPIGQSETMAYDVFGNIASKTDINGLTTSYKYDAFGSLIQTNTPEGHTIKTSVNWAIKGNRLYYINTQAPGVPNNKTYYDSFGRALQSETDGFSGKIYSDKEYNNKGQLERESLPYYSGKTKEWTEYKYWDEGSINTKTFKGFLTTTYSYPAKKITITDPANQKTTKTINDLGNVVSATDNGGAITYYYYSSGLVKKIRSLGSSTINMEYDEFGNQTQLDDPDAGIMKYSYNSFGDLLSQTDANSNTFGMTYDKLGRIETKKGPDGTTTYVYDTETNGIGLLTSVSKTNNTSQSYKYDEYCRPRELTENIEGNVFTTSYVYDEYGNNTKIVYPSKFSVVNVYDDNNGFLTEVKRGGDNAKSIWKAEEVNSLGQIKVSQIGGHINSFRTIKTFNTYHHLTNQKSIDSQNNLLYNIDYDFEATTGNLLTRKNKIKNLTETFSYDNLNRLKSSQLTGQDAISLLYNKHSGNICS